MTRLILAAVLVLLASAAAAQDWWWNVPLRSLMLGTPVAWGQLNRAPNGTSISIRVARRSWRIAGSGDGPRWERLNVSDIRHVEPVRHPSASTRSRVIWSDESATIIDHCAWDSYPVGCSPYDLWRTWIDAVSAAWPGRAEVWNSAIRVSSASSGCRESIVVNGAVIRHYDRGSFPGRPRWVRLKLARGDAIHTCFEEWQLLGSARGTWP